MSIVNPTYIDHSRLDGENQVPNNIQAVLNSIINELTNGTSLKAPVFSNQSTYTVGKFCKYNDVLYVCHTAVVVAGEWTGTTNWVSMDNVQSLFSTSDTALVQTIKSTVPATALKPTDVEDEYEINPEAANPWDQKVDTISCSGVQDITAVGGNANVNTLFSNNNTSLFNMCRYTIIPITISGGIGTATDSAINTITLSENTVIAPPASTGKVRDWVVYVTESSTTAYTISFTGRFVKDFTNWPIITAGEKYVFSFTEMNNDVFLVGYKKVS